jgi:hypothetical protein
MVRHVQHIAKQVHRTRALAVLENDSSGRWLADKPDVLDELGRIDSNYALVAIARRISELKPTTAEAVEMIRRHREFNQLADEIVHTINEHIKRNPDTQLKDVKQALQTVDSMLGQFDAYNEPGTHQFLRKADQAPPQEPPRPKAPPPAQVPVKPNKVLGPPRQSAPRTA